MDVAALNLSIDSEGVLRGEAALDRFSKSSDTASAAADKVAAASKRGGEGASQMGRSYQQAEAAAKALGVAQSTTASRAMDMAEAAQRAAAASNAAAGGMNNGSSAGKMFAMQLSQVAQQGSATGNYLQALAIQLPDIAIGMSSAGASAGAFARFLGGPWGIALASAAAALVPLISKLFETKDAADRAKFGLDALIAKYRQERAERNASATSQADLNKLLERRGQLEAEIAQRGVRGANGQLMFVYKQQQELKEVNQGIYEGRLAIDRYRVSAIDLNSQMTQIYTSQMKVEKSTKAHSAATRVAKKDTDEFATSLAAVARSLGQYQQDALDGLVAKMAKIDAANEAAFGQQLQAATDAAASNINNVASANEAWNDQLRDTLDYLGSLGGAAGVLGGIGSALMGLQSGNFSGVGGPAGYLLNTIGNMQWRDPATADGLGQIRLMREEFAKVLDGVFGSNGKFFQAIEGAGMGVAAGSVFGSSSANQLGGALGGVAGKVAGEALGKAIGGTLGKAMGPLGSIIGGALGSAISGLFKKDKYGTTTIVGGEGYGTSGNSQKNQTGANSLADNFQSVLNNIAKTFGTTLGNFAVSIGVTNGKINVNPGQVTGMIGTTKQRDTIDFGEDQAAALKYAIRNAIEDGALEGLSEGWKKFILESSDIEKALGQISNLKSAYDELASLKDPQGFAIEQLNKAFDELRKTATAAGDDLAKVEELYGLKRKEIVENYASESRDLEIEILQLQGRAEEALALSRQAELDAADASIRPLMERRNALLDEATAAQAATAAAEAAAQAQKAADERIFALQIRLSRAQGNEATAKALEQMQELNEAQTEQERSMLRMIHAIDDAMEAQEKLTGGFATTADIINRITSETYEMTKSLREFADSIFGKEDLADSTAQYQELVEKAAMGDKSALAKLPDAINAYLGQAQNQASSLADYQIAAAYARQAAYGVADVADARANYGAIAAGISAKFGGPFNPGGDPNYVMTAGDTDALTSAFQAMQEELRELRETVARSGQAQVDATNEVAVNTKSAAKTLKGASNGAGFVMVNG